MFEYIKGTLEEMLEDSIVIESNNIGYKIYTSVQTLNQLFTIGSKIKIYIHMNIKEDDISLYGFFTKEERNLYRKLISVSGVGPRAAIGILSVYNVKDIIWSIIGEDIKSLTKAPGIGKKMAQRIILELKDKLKEEQNGILEISTQNMSGDTTIKDEAVGALIALGYPSSQSHQVITSIFKEGLDVETLIKKALKVFGSK